MKKSIVCLALIALQIYNFDASAQKNGQLDKTKYLVGAVPEIDGKVVFSQVFNVPGATKDELYHSMLNWLEKRLAENENQNSRVVYQNAELGQIAGIGEEWLVFKSSALALDRTLINYQISILCENDSCKMEVEKIRYTYREKEKYSADEWIVDKMALNKAKTKMVLGLEKWRVKTVDFVNSLFKEAGTSIGATSESGKTIRKAVQMETITPLKQSEQAVQSNSTITTPTTAKQTELKEVAPLSIPKSAIQIGKGRLVISIGEDIYNMTTITANAGGSIGTVDSQPVIFTILSPDQPFEAVESAENYTVRFIPTDSKEPSVVLECKKMPTPPVYEGQPRTFVGKIVKAWISE